MISLENHRVKMLDYMAKYNNRLMFRYELGQLIFSWYVKSILGINSETENTVTIM